jgi:hypothetical protein
MNSVPSDRKTALSWRGYVSIQHRASKPRPRFVGSVDENLGNSYYGLERFQISKRYRAGNRAVQPAIDGQFAVLGYPFTTRFIPLVSTADLAAARPIARDKKRIAAELRQARELVGADEERALLIDENDYIFSKFAGISH